jgi:uncharacterized protein with HEPN domain
MTWKYPNEPTIFIEHVYQCIEDIQSYTHGIDRSGFFADTMTQDAVVRKIEIIGEAIKNLPEAIRKNYPDIPWENMEKMRDIVIREHFEVDLNYAWDVVTVELPKLEPNIRIIVKELNS